MMAAAWELSLTVSSSATIAISSETSSSTIMNPVSLPVESQSTFSPVNTALLPQLLRAVRTSAA